MSKRRYPQKPPRSWELDDLLNMGRRSGALYLQAVPILVLEKWVRGGRREGRDNLAETDDLARRLEHSGLVLPFKDKGTSNVLGAFTKKQHDRSGQNLTDPPLVITIGGGLFSINLPHYEPLLQKHRREFSELYPSVYKSLFPEGEPVWEGPSPVKERVEHKEKKPVRLDSEELGEASNLLLPLKQAVSDLEQGLEKLVEQKQKLQVELDALLASRPVIKDKELEKDCAEFLKREDTYIDAIRRAGVVLEERLKRTMGGDGPERFKQGVDLVDYALMPSQGRLVVSEYPAEQEGVRMLFRGAVQFVRNPPSHKKLQYTELEANRAIGLIDYLLSLLQQARRREE